MRDDIPADSTEPKDLGTGHEDSLSENVAKAPPVSIMLPAGLIFLSGSIAMILWACGAIFEHVEAKQIFKETTGQIVATGAQEVRVYRTRSNHHTGGRSHRGPTYQDLDLLYEYKVDGNSYTGGLLDFGENIRPTKWSVDVVLNKYPKGANVPVYYDPADPRRAILQLEWPAENLLCILMGGSFAFLFLGLMLSSVARPGGGPLRLLSRLAFEPGRVLAALTLLNALLMCALPWFFGPLTVKASIVGGIGLGLLVAVRRIAGDRREPASQTPADEAP